MVICLLFNLFHMRLVLEPRENVVSELLGILSTSQREDAAVVMTGVTLYL
jgi:hypothetical protein